MNTVSPDLERQVQALHNLYVRSIDDDRLEDWPSLFTFEGVYRITSRENAEQSLPLSIMLCEGRGMMKDRVTGFRRINVFEPQRYRHQISGLIIRKVEGATVRCVSNFLVVRTLESGTMTLFATGVYQDSILVDGDQARFQERTVITDSRQVDTLLVIPL